MVSPASTTSYGSTARARWRAVMAQWTAFGFRHREFLVTYGISAALHATLFLVLGTALFRSGNDDADLPELSVQLETREGPSSETFTEAALPRPLPEPERLDDLLDDPGTGSQVIDAPALASNQPTAEEIPLDVEAALESALAQQLPQQASVLTTTGESDQLVAARFDPAPTPEIAVPEAEQAMLARNVQQLAQRLLDTNLTDSELSWQQDGQQYSARVIRQPAPDSTGLEQVIAEVTTDKDGKRMKTRLSLKRLAFSHFAQLVNHWDPNIMLHDDVIDGRFHSNTEIGIAFSRGIQPRFFGKVTTAAAHLTRSETMPRKRSKDVFQGGVETRTERVLLPRDMPEVLGGGEQDDRVVFSEDTRIIFHPDGTYMWRSANGKGTPTVRSRSTRPMYLIGADGAKLFVRGTVCGIYTVYSPADIEIEGDITYSRDPRDAVISGDYLALISGRDVRISGARITGIGDLHIHAAIFARRRFVIEAVNHGRNGRLMILGSLTAGTILETEPRYATQLDFDKRFEYLRPASFPMTRRYEVDSWDQDWREVAGPEIQPEHGLARSE